MERRGQKRKDEGTPLRAVVGEGPELMRAGLKSLLSLGGVVVVGEATTWEEMLQLVRSLSPDVLVFDFDLCPGRGWSLSRLEECVGDLKTVKFIVLGPSAGSANVGPKLREFGVYGYLSKNASTAEGLVSCVRRVAAGGVYFELDERAAGVQESGVVVPDLKMLSRRQVDVLLCIAEGLSSKQIGLKLGISVKTVESHRSNLMERLNIFDVASLVKFAITSGLIKLEDSMV